MNRTLIALVLICSINADARTAIEELEIFNKKNIQNKDEKNSVIQLLNGAEKGINFKRTMNRTEFETAINAAQQAVIVNGAYYDWFHNDLITSLTNSAKASDTKKNKAFVTLLQEYRPHGGRWKKKNIFNLLDSDVFKDRASKLRKHQAFYFMANRYLQFNYFKQIYAFNDTKTLANLIYDQLQSNGLTNVYGETEKSKAIEEIEKFGKNVINTARQQEDLIDISEVKIDVDYKLISLSEFKGYKLKDGPMHSADKQVGYTPPITRAQFNGNNEIIGIEYSDERYYSNLFKANKSMQGVYGIAPAIAKINETWGDVASLFTINNGGQPMLHLFWVSTEDAKESAEPLPDHNQGVIYGYLDSDLLQKGTKGGGNIRKLIQLSKFPKKMSAADRATVVARAESLGVAVSNWKGKTYPVQLLRKYIEQFNEFYGQAIKPVDVRQLYRDAAKLHGKSFNVNIFISEFIKKYNSKAVKKVMDYTAIGWGSKRKAIETKALNNIFEINKVWDIFGLVASGDYSTYPMLIPAQEDISITGFPYYRLQKSKAVEVPAGNPIIIQVNKTGWFYELTGLKAKLLGNYYLNIPHLADPLSGSFFRKMLKTKQTSFYEIEDTLDFYTGAGEFANKFSFASLHNQDIGDMYETLYKVMFTPKIIYMVVEHKVSELNLKARLVIHQATPGIPSPRMLRKLQVFRNFVKHNNPDHQVEMRIYDGLDLDDLVKQYNKKTWQAKGTAYGNLDALKKHFEVK